MYSGSRSRSALRAAPRPRAVPPHHVGDQPPVPGRPRAPAPPPRAPRHAPQRRLDLAQLDAEAADLDLVVEPAEELEVAVRPGSAPGRRCGRAGRPARRRTDRARTAPPSAPAGPDSRAPGPTPPMYSSPGTPDRHRRAVRGRARRAACSRSAGRSATLAQAGIAGSHRAAWRPTVASVGPYSVDQPGARARARRPAPAARPAAPRRRGRPARSAGTPRATAASRVSACQSAGGRVHSTVIRSRPAPSSSRSATAARPRRRAPAAPPAQQRPKHLRRPRRRS